MQSWVHAIGLSGQTYVYQPYDRFVSWRDVPGNYEFAKFNPSTNAWTVFYIGEAANIRDRMCGHDRWLEALRLGATHVLAHVSSADAAVRRAEERDLIQRYNPTLNTQNRTTTNELADLLNYDPFGFGSLGWSGLGFGLGSSTPSGKR